MRQTDLEMNVLRSERGERVKEGRERGGGREREREREGGSGRGGGEEKRRGGENGVHGYLSQAFVL